MSEENTEAIVSAPLFFDAFKNRHFRFVSMLDNHTIKAWEMCKDGTWNVDYLGKIDVRHIDQETLKFLEIWDKIDPKVQKEILEKDLIKKAEVNALMEKARAGRRKKYINMPDKVECIQCHTAIKIPPSVLMARIEKINKDKNLLWTVDDYVKQFKCQKCCPSKGRKPNPEFANLPDELVCKCGTKVILNAIQLKKKSLRVGKSITELIENYKCQKCEPTVRRVGRPKKVKVSTE